MIIMHVPVVYVVVGGNGDLLCVSCSSIAPKSKHFGGRLLSAKVWRRQIDGITDDMRISEKSAYG